MQQQISVITLGVADLVRSRRFYAEGFGWTPVFENPEVVFYQMNGFVLATWRREALAADMGRAAPSSGFALAHNVRGRADVEPAMRALLAAGGELLAAAVDKPWGGRGGYVADPDGHAWEIAWNPDWPISPEGHVTFAA